MTKNNKRIIFVLYKNKSLIWANNKFEIYFYQRVNTFTGFFTVVITILDVVCPDLNTINLCLMTLSLK